MNEAMTTFFASIAKNVHPGWCGWSMEGTIAVYRIATTARDSENRRVWVELAGISMEWAEWVLTLSEGEQWMASACATATMRKQVKWLHVPTNAKGGDAT